MRWTEVREVQPFLIGQKNSIGVGGATYSLHKGGRVGWIVKRYHGKSYVAGEWMYETARVRWNQLLVELSGK